MYENSRTKSVNKDDYPCLTDFLDEKCREKMLVGDADIIDQQEDENTKPEQEEY